MNYETAHKYLKYNNRGFSVSIIISLILALSGLITFAAQVVITILLLVISFVIDRVIIGEYIRHLEDED